MRSRQKSGKKYSRSKILFIAGVLITYCVLCPCFILVLFMTPGRLALLIPVTVLFFVSMVITFYMFFNLIMFGYDFSIIGPYERRSRPDEKRIARFFGWGRITLLINIPFLIFTVYPSGLEIFIPCNGKVFIPSENIVNIELDTLAMLFLTPYKLVHSSREIQNPFYLPPFYRLYEELMDLRESHRTEAGQQDL